jgi:hypothetical protein
MDKNVVVTGFEVPIRHKGKRLGETKDITEVLIRILVPEEL